MDVKGFVLRFFAVVGLVLAFALGWAVWSVAGLMGPAGLMAAAGHHPEKTAPKTIVLDLDFVTPMAERQPDFHLSLASLMKEENQQDYFEIVRAIQRAKDDPRVKGITARLGTERPPLVYVQEIASALRAFRESGKFTYIFAPSYGDFGPGGNAAYTLASQFENIWLQPVGAVGVTGLAMEAPFGKTALERLGITGDFMRREDFKSVMENVTNDGFSAPVKANMTAMVQDMAAQIAQEMAQGRKKDVGETTAWMNDGPFTANEALKAGLVTKIDYDDVMVTEAKDKAGKDAELVDSDTYLSLPAASKTPKAKARIAVIYAEGILTDTQPHGPAKLAERSDIDTDEVVEAFDDAAKDSSIKAILFRVNSPGGSPVASETIRHALVKAKESKKPVFVSMGAVAASGGYWISMSADRIIADPATITGSIGVVAGKFVIGKLAENLGVKFDGITTSDTAGMLSPASPFSDKARERMNAMLDETYQAFTDHVAKDRKIDPTKMPDLAKGRVYTGKQALEVHLVDELGGMQTAIDALKKELKIEEKDKVELVTLPAPVTAEALFRKTLESLRFGGAMLMDMAHTWAQLREPLSAALQAMQNDGQVRVQYQGY